MSRDEYYLGIAAAVAKKSTCLRKQYGAVIVKDNEVIATGYNGAPRGEAHCETCSKVHANKDSEEYLTCRSVHAEMNAIISAARRDMLGATLYLFGWDKHEMPDPRPCNICERLIKNAGIAKVITKRGIIYENKNH